MMYVSLNKPTHIVSKWSRHFISAVPGIEENIPPLISKVPAGNIALHCEQHVAHELRVDQPWIWGFTFLYSMRLHAVSYVSRREIFNFTLKAP
jgi:hypothetical protein